MHPSTRTVKKYIPEPMVRLVFQKGDGERYVVVGMNHTHIHYTPIGRDEQLQGMTRGRWNYGFTYDNWLSI